MRNLALVLVAGLLPCAAPAAAQSAPGVEYHSRAELQASVASAATSPSRMAGKLLGNRGSYTYILLRRDQTSEVELHEAWDDLMLIQEGTATVLYGGVASGGRETAPGELRGGQIVGGIERPVAAGDVILLPAGVPHQVRLEAGESITYIIVKARTAPGAAQP
jgi:mannose-6-phosphate isomerase-like protein (cupin superfamily)